MALPLFLLFIFISVAITIAGYFKYVRTPSMLKRLSDSYDTLADTTAGAEAWGQITRFIRKAGSLLPLSPQDARLARFKLGSAGYRAESALSLLQGIRILSASILLLVDLLLRGRIFSNHVLSMVSIAAMPALGYLMPGVIVDHLASRRAVQLRTALPDMLDLLVVCTEAGSGLDQAMLRVSHELKDSHRALSEELAIVNYEMMAGKSREDALRNLATRTREPELAKLTAVLIQADRFGTSVADTLRTQSEFMRTRRRQEAQERAAKVGVKIIFPIFFFCFPAMLIIVAGPGLLMLAKTLIPLLAQVR